MSPPKLPKRLRASERSYLPTQHRRLIHVDVIHPADLARFELRFFCDDCSHFNMQAQRCTIGYRAQHTRLEQLRLYELTGRMALCRAIEID